MKKLILLLLVAAVGYIGYLALHEKPGEGPKAEAGRKASQPVIVALEAYRLARGQYPEDLDELSLGMSGVLPKQIDGNPVLYTRTDSGYELTFSYASPLPTHCTYTTVRKWQCGYLTKKK